MEKIIKFKDFKMNEPVHTEFPLSMKEVFKKTKKIYDVTENKYIDNPYYVESSISPK
jgi:hypothetical protein